MRNKNIGKDGQVKLSERQQRILRYVYEHRLEHGFSPSIRDIGKAIGMGSTSVINYNLNRLVEYGLLVRRSDTSRSLVLCAEAYRVLGEALPEGEEVRRLRAQVEALEAENGYLLEQNKRLERALRSLKRTVISRVEAAFG